MATKKQRPASFHTSLCFGRNAASIPSAVALAGCRILQLLPSPRKAQTPLDWVPAMPSADTIWSTLRSRSFAQAAAQPNTPQVAVACQPRFRCADTPNAMPTRFTVSHSRRPLPEGTLFRFFQDTPHRTGQAADQTTADLNRYPASTRLSCHMAFPPDSRLPRPVPVSLLPPADLSPPRLPH